MRIGETVFLSSGERVQILTISLSARKIMVALPEDNEGRKGRKWVEYDGRHHHEQVDQAPSQKGFQRWLAGWWGLLFFVFGGNKTAIGTAGNKLI